jgi:hypothetical protein
MSNVKKKTAYVVGGVMAVAIGLTLFVGAQLQESPPPPGQDGGPDGPPFGGGGFGRGPGGFGGAQEETKLVEQFDQNGDGWLNAAERKAAREHLQKERGSGRGRHGFGPPGSGGRFGGRGGNQEPAKPGVKLAPANVKSFPEAPLYDPQVLRTFFLEFENSDWEKELADFHNTDVEVPAKLTVDGKTYRDVGVHFRGMSSYMMVGEGWKRSLNLSLDFVHKDQNLGGYRTLNLLNSHEDPSFLRVVLASEVARAYLPAPKANFARVAINGESWGVYVNMEQFNKDFAKEWFGTTKGARWKVRGSPNGRGSLAYLGDEIAPYKRIYTIKTKDDRKRWADLITLCKVLNETPPDKLEAALEPLLDIDEALKFIALDVTLINNDGYWIRTSDYAIYQDEKRRFHLIPQDINETFARPGGPGFGGGPGGRGGPGRFGPGMMLAPRMLSQADKNNDERLSKSEFLALAERWFDKLDPDKTGKVSQESFTERLREVLPTPGGGGFGPPGGGGFGPPGRGGFEPGRSLAPGLFTALDVNKDGSLVRDELKQTFGKWFDEWDGGKTGELNEEQLRSGLMAALPRPNFGGRGAGRGGRDGGPEGGGGFGPGGGPGGGPGQQTNASRIKGVELDPLYAANDSNKPLISKLLAVPSLRARYLAHVRDIAEKWLDWKNLGPIAERYHALIAEDVKADTRKLDSTEDFFKALTEDTGSGGFGPPGGGTIGLKNFADQRRQYLLGRPENNGASK